MSSPTTPTSPTHPACPNRSTWPTRPTRPTWPTPSCPLPIFDRQPVEVAGGHRFRSFDERVAARFRAERGSELAGRGVDVGVDDAAGGVEGLAGVAGEGAAHELRPDRQRRLGAGKADWLVVVETDPGDGQQLGREADEPGIAQIVGRAGLAGGIEREA